MNREIPPIMTFAQCQNILHVGKNTLLAMLHDGSLQGFKIGSRWRITREDLAEYVEDSRSKNYNFYS